MKMSVTTRSALDPSAEVLTWDTEFWGVKVGRAYSSDVDQWARDNMIGCMCLLIPADDTNEIQAAEERGFRMMDVRMTLERSCPYEDWYMPEAKLEHAEQFAEIARASHWITRFYADPRFPVGRCDDLYETWIRSSLAGWADVVLTTDYVSGYCTLHVNGDTGTIGLIAVAEDARSAGLGGKLVRGAINWCHGKGLEKISVVTQGCNIPALRLFERSGFQTVSTEVWLHKWYV